MNTTLYHHGCMVIPVPVSEPVSSSLRKWLPTGRLSWIFQFMMRKKRDLQRVVFVIRKAIEKEFKEVIGTDCPRSCCRYVYQGAGGSPQKI